MKALIPIVNVKVTCVIHTGHMLQWDAIITLHNSQPIALTRCKNLFLSQTWESRSLQVVAKWSYIWMVLIPWTIYSTVIQSTTKAQQSRLYTWREEEYSLIICYRWFMNIVHSIFCPNILMETWICHCKSYHSFSPRANDKNIIATIQNYNSIHQLFSVRYDYSVNRRYILFSTLSERGIVGWMILVWP